MVSFFKNNWQLILEIGTPAASVLVATLISVFSDRDHNPETPPPAWVQVLMWFQRWLSAYAPKGTEGIKGSRASIPFLHSPRRKATPGTPTPPAPASPPAA